MDVDNYGFNPDKKSGIESLKAPNFVYTFSPYAKVWSGMHSTHTTYCELCMHIFAEEERKKKIFQCAWRRQL